MLCSLFVAWAATAVPPYAAQVPGLSSLPSRSQEIFEAVAGEEFCGCDSALTLLGCLKQRPKCALATDLGGALKRAVQSGASHTQVATFMSQSVLGPFCSPPVQLDANDAPLLGEPRAPYSVIEFFDYRCSHCRASMPQLRDAMKRAGKKASLHLLPVALVEHSPSSVAGEAALAAQAQGQFWRMHDALFALDESQLTEAGVRAAAKKIGLNMPRFVSELKSGKPAQRLARYRQHFVALGLDGTPAMFVNGRRSELEPTIFDLDARLAMEAHRDDPACR